MPSTRDLLGFAEDIVAADDDAELVAGLLVTSVFAMTVRDGWLDEYAWRCAFDQAIGVKNDKVRREFAMILAALRDEIPARRAGPLLLAYGLSLKDAGRFSAALSVFRMLAREATTDIDLRVQASQQAAQTLRVSGRGEEAILEFQATEFLARGAKDDHMVLEARLGEAAAHGRCGRTAESLRLTKAVQVSARRKGNAPMLGKAMAQEASIAGRLGGYGAAASLSEQALPLLSGRDRDRARAIFARARYHLGDLETAKEIAIHNWALGMEWECRCDAILLLVAISLDEGDRERAEAIAQRVRDVRGLPYWVYRELDVLLPLRRAISADEPASGVDEATAAVAVVSSQSG